MAHDYGEDGNATLWIANTRAKAADAAYLASGSYSMAQAPAEAQNEIHANAIPSKPLIRVTSTDRLDQASLATI